MTKTIRTCSFLFLLLSVPAAAQYNCYIYGMHDYNSEIAGLLTHNGEPRGWVLILQSLDGYTGGVNPDVVNAANAGLGVLVRLHWGYGTAGTLPPVSQYPTFASRAATFISTHIDYCKFYHIGNEPNFCAEWPGGGVADGGCDPNCTSIREQITAARYIDCFEQVYNALSPSLQSEAKLLVAPTGTWAGEFTCAGTGFETFDYVCYQRTIYAGIPDYMIGGFALHPKTHAHEVWQITDNSLSSTPAFGCGHNEYVHWYFRVYRDMMDDIPVGLRDRPVFFTELNPHESGWIDTNNGYVQAAYDEIDAWNSSHPDRLITAMMLYRWDDGDDRWDIHSRNQVKADLAAAVANGQTSNGCASVVGTPTPTPPTGEPGANLLANWSFEGSGGGSLDGWTVQPSFILDNTVPSGNPPPDGSHWAGHSYTGGTPSIREAYQTVTVGPGHRHLLRVQVMGGGFSGGISTGRLQWYNGDYPGFGSGQNVAVFSWPADEPGMIWKEMSGIVTPTSNHLTFVLQVQVEGNWVGAGINFDAAELRDMEPVSTPTPTTPPPPTATNTPVPTATHTPIPTATPTNTPTDTPDPNGTTGAAGWRAY